MNFPQFLVAHSLILFIFIWHLQDDVQINIIAVRGNVFNSSLRVTPQRFYIEPYNKGLLFKESF